MANRFKMLRERCRAARILQSADQKNMQATATIHHSSSSGFAWLYNACGAHNRAVVGLEEDDMMFAGDGIGMQR